VVAIPGKGSFITRLKRPRTHTIGSVISSTGPLGLSLLKGIQDRCSELNQSGLIENYGFRKRLGLPRIKGIMEREQVDGFIIWPDKEAEDVDAIIDYLHECKIPFVLAPLVEFQEYKNCTTVTNIDSAPASDIMTHLIGGGYKNIGFVTSKKGAKNFYSVGRHTQYLRSLQVSNLDPHPTILIEESSDKDASPKVVRQLKALDAVFCNTDRIAMGVIRACLRNNIQVPNDLAIASFGNTDFGLQLGLTSVEQNFEKIGQRAVDRLLEEIEGTRIEPTHELIEGELMIRQSTLKQA
jgi:DNA-binding LacI/PurR family transcriptional regulator